MAPTNSCSNRFYLINFFLFFLISLITQAQNEGHRLKINQIGWSISIPNEFILSDSITIKKTLAKGRLIAQSGSDTITLRDYGMKILFSAHYLYTNISASLQPFNDGIIRWEEDIKNTHKLTVLSFQKKMPNVEINTLVTQDTIDNIIFRKFTLTVVRDKSLSVHMVTFSTLYKKFDFGINYVYIDDKWGQKIYECVKASKFYK